METETDNVVELIDNLDAPLSDDELKCYALLMQVHYNFYRIEYLDNIRKTARSAIELYKQSDPDDYRSLSRNAAKSHLDKCLKGLEQLEDRCMEIVIFHHNLAELGHAVPIFNMEYLGQPSATQWEELLTEVQILKMRIFMRTENLPPPTSYQYPELRGYGLPSRVKQT